MARSAEELKQLSVKEFTEAAKIYESGHAGIYEMCKDDYPQMLDELALEPFEDVLDVGCGTGAVLELLHGEYPGKHLTGLDLTPKMIEAARAKQLGNVRFVVGDAEALPFESQSFDAALCSNSFHHYPHPERFFAEAARVLRPGGRLILRDYTSSDFVVWLMNTFELPLDGGNLFRTYGMRDAVTGRDLEIPADCLDELESRPIPGRDFEFMFYFDLDCPFGSKALDDLLDSIDDVCESFTYFGSYTEVF